MNQTQLHFLGSGDAFGSGGRLQPCLLLQNGNDSFLIDCGASSLSAIKQAGVNPSNIGGVLISHLHGDHFGGLPFLILDGQFSKRTGSLLVAGPAGMKQRVATVMEAFFSGSTASPRRFTIEFIELRDRVATQVGAGLVTPFAVRQPSGASSFALRVELGSKVLGYSGDTEWTETLVEVARGADLFVCEAYFFEKDIPYHLSYKTLLKHQGELSCGRLVITHMHQDLLTHVTELEIESASDGLVIVL